MGAYFILYPHVRVFAILPLGFCATTEALPAWTMLIYWMLIQVVCGLTAIGGKPGGVAFWAHVGGFIAGIVLVNLFARPDYVAAHQAS